MLRSLVGSEMCIRDRTWMDDTLQQLNEFEQILGKDKKVTPVSSPTSAPKVPTSRPLSKADNLNANRAKRHLVEPVEPTPAQIALQKQQEREARREKDLQELRMRMKEGRKEAAKEPSPLNVDVRTPVVKSPIGPPLVPSGRRQSPQLATPTAASSPPEPLILAGRRRSQAPQEPVFRAQSPPCLLYTSDAADEEDSVDLGGRRIITKKNKDKTHR
eukprot:TRINITY_DN16897_c0_g1_i1.p1 TRINITY_DN16897_c0_g1~~TRINITY_DN16897_c0_g1_i1.p1  ORF type:complete len:216 (-),score=42.37 TRINITY_DN16897_c0_g1_i1:18-665(-)